MGRPETILALTPDEHRRVAAEHLANLPHRYEETSEGHALAAIAHALLALSTPEEKP